MSSQSFRKILRVKNFRVFLFFLFCCVLFLYGIVSNNIVKGIDYEPSTCKFCEDGSSFICVTNFSFHPAHCSNGPESYEETEGLACSDCNDGSQVCLVYCRTEWIKQEYCNIDGGGGLPFTVYDSQKANSCPGGGPPPSDTNGQAELRNLTCPVSCAPGQNFNITYEYRATNYTGQVDIWRKVMAYGHPPYLGSLQWHTTGDPETSCKVSSLTSPSNWQVATQAINCSEIWEGYNQNPNLVVYGYNRDTGAPGYTSWCDDTFPSSDAQLACWVKKTVQSLGYLKIYHQALGVIKLNLISAGDAKAKSPFPGMVKVARFNGDIGSAADLVPVSDPMASPVRVYTGLTGAGSPNGIWAWKKLP